MNERVSGRIAELEKQVADVKARLPRHSIPPAMLMDLEDLEQELERAIREAERSSDA